MYIYCFVLSLSLLKLDDSFITTINLLYEYKSVELFIINLTKSPVGRYVVDVNRSITNVASWITNFYTGFLRKDVFYWQVWRKIIFNITT